MKIYDHQNYFPKVLRKNFTLMARVELFYFPISSLSNIITHENWDWRKLKLTKFSPLRYSITWGSFTKYLFPGEGQFSGRQFSWGAIFRGAIFRRVFSLGAFFRGPFFLEPNMLLDVLLSAVFVKLKSFVSYNIKLFTLCFDLYFFY